MKMPLKNFNQTLRTRLTSLTQAFSHLSVSIRCLVCKGHTTFSSPICSNCLQCLPAPDAFCSQCGLPMPDSYSELCAQCLQQRPPFDICLSAFIYRYPVNHIIQKIKYNRRLELISPMVSPLIDALIDHYLEHPWPDAIIPVPLHKKKIRTRGFNQSLLLAKAISKKLPEGIQCPLVPELITKQRDTQPQQNLPAKARRKNIRGAFTVSNKISYKHIAVIDDVVTTSETVSEISRTLKKKGVQQVDVWCLARTPQDY